MQIVGKGVAEDKGHVVTPLAAVKAIMDTLGELRQNHTINAGFNFVPAWS